MTFFITNYELVFRSVFNFARCINARTRMDKKYALALVTLQGRENEPKIPKLNQLLVHPNVKDFINKEYKKRLIPVF
nr:MetQ/NlpA family ABC transporter substrate-binding protein [Nostoc sp. JL31]